MMLRLYFICSLYFTLYLLVGHSYDDFQFLNDDNNMSAKEKIQNEKLGEEFIKLHRVKRAGPANSTSMYSSLPSFSSIPPPPPSSLPPTSSRPPPTSMMYGNASSIPPGSTMSPVQSNNQTIPTITGGISMTTGAPSRPYPISSYNPDTCGIANYIKLVNGTCVLKPDGQMIAAGILSNSSNDVTSRANALSLYISSVTNSTATLNRPYVLSANDIDNITNQLTGVNLTISSNTSFVSIQQPQIDNNIFILGASFTRGIGGALIDTTNKDNVTKSQVSAAAIVDKNSLNGVVSLNILIVDKPTGYENADNVTNKTLLSSVIVVDLIRNSSTTGSLGVSLYFQSIAEYQKNGNGKYLCSFYDTNTLTWNEYGCSDAVYVAGYNRYECSCNHTTSFALIWLPQSLLTSMNTQQLDAQDIASLVVLSISILCFLAIIIHAICLRFLNSSMSVPAYNLLPLISTASSTILFIFYIALGVTVYLQTSSSTQTECFLSSSILMFTVYFSLIFMFCVKTSIGYFYYLRFVRLFPNPSFQTLTIMLIISFLISSICVAVAIGFNAKASYSIIQLYPYKLCWFTPTAVYYFMTLPIGLALSINILAIIFVMKSLITHVRHAKTSEQVTDRLKRCAIVLLASCIAQGIGWIFGPFISIVSATAGNVFGWIFIVLDGLEGVWSILLYIFIRRQRMDEQKYATPLTNRLSSAESYMSKNKNNPQVFTKQMKTIRPFVSNDLRQREMKDLFG